MHYGSWVWYDLNTTDVDAAARFYGEVVGWKWHPPKDGNNYTEFSYDDQHLGGFVPLREEAKEMGARPHWAGYVGVKDVAATVARARELGAMVLVDTTDMEGVGSFAVLEDPTGAVFSLYASAKDVSDWEPRAPSELGSFAWNELYTTDPDAAWDFYAGLFGWEKTDAMDMGPMGVYQLFGKGDVNWGGMMKAPDEMPMSGWIFYLTVGDVEAAVERVKSNGGQLLNGPHDVPGGRIAQCMDPQGAMFALHHQL